MGTTVHIAKSSVLKQIKFLYLSISSLYRATTSSDLIHIYISYFESQCGVEMLACSSPSAATKLLSVLSTLIQRIFNHLLRIFFVNIHHFEKFAQMNLVHYF